MKWYGHGTYEIVINIKKWLLNSFLNLRKWWRKTTSIIILSQIQTQNLNIPVGISKIPEEGVWTRVCMSPWQHLNGISECPMVKPSRKAAPTPSFATSVCSAVGGSTRLNLDPGSGRCLSSPLPPVAEQPSNESSFIVLPERSAGLMGGHLLAGLCVSPRTTLCCHSSCDPLLEPPNRTNFHHNQTVLLPQFQLDLYPLCCELLEPHEAPGMHISPSASGAV